MPRKPAAPPWTPPNAPPAEQRSPRPAPHGQMPDDAASPPAPPPPPGARPPKAPPAAPVLRSRPSLIPRRAAPPPRSRIASSSRATRASGLVLERGGGALNRRSAMDGSDEQARVCSLVSQERRPRPRPRPHASAKRRAAKPARRAPPLRTPQACERAGAVARSGPFLPSPPDQAKRARRWEMMPSASDMIRSISSFTVGTSWIRPWIMPAVQTP